MEMSLYGTANYNCLYQFMSFYFKRISRMTYKPKGSPKSAGKMAEFESLTLFISLNSSQICTNFCKDLWYISRNLDHF